MGQAAFEQSAVQYASLGVVRPSNKQCPLSQLELSTVQIWAPAHPPPHDLPRSVAVTGGRSGVGSVFGVPPSLLGSPDVVDAGEEEQPATTTARNDQRRSEGTIAPSTMSSAEDSARAQGGEGQFAAHSDRDRAGQRSTASLFVVVLLGSGISVAEESWAAGALQRPARVVRFQKKHGARLAISS